VVKALTLIEEVEALGGMTKAIAQGLPKMRIEEAAAKKQGRIDTGKDKIVGVNIFPSENVPLINLLDVDTQKVRDIQIERLHKVKALEIALDELEQIAISGNGNLLEGAVKVARLRGTLGEISYALEKVFGRYKPVNHTISGVYGKELAMDADFIHAMELSDQWEALDGRRPRILIAKLGQEQKLLPLVLLTLASMSI
jgi:methylmalonyl-CoA mutase